jgi:hypothetical protein
MIITRHARERYVERIRPGADMREAALVLLDAADRAVNTGKRTFSGDLLWEVNNPPMFLVTKHDPEAEAVCVTVLHPEEMRDIVRDVRAACEVERTPVRLPPAPWSPEDVAERIEARVAELRAAHEAEEATRNERWRAECEARIAKRQAAQAQSIAIFDAAEARRQELGLPLRPDERAARVWRNERALANLRSSFGTPPSARVFDPIAARGRAECEVYGERRRALGLPTNRADKIAKHKKAMAARGGRQ